MHQTVRCFFKFNQFPNGAVAALIEDSNSATYTEGQQCYDFGTGNFDLNIRVNKADKLAVFNSYPSPSSALRGYLSVRDFGGSKNDQLQTVIRHRSGNFYNTVVKGSFINGKGVSFNNLSSVTLPFDDYNMEVLIVTSATQDADFILPAQANRHYIIQNPSAFTITCKALGGTGVAIPPTTNKMIWISYLDYELLIN